MTLVIGKKILPTVALMAMLFLSFPSTTNGQTDFVPTISPDDLGLQTNQQGASGTATFAASSTAHDSGDNGAPSAGRRLGFTGFREDVFNVLSSLGAMVAWLGGFLLDSAIGIFTVGMYNTTVFFKLDETIEAMWAVIRDIFNLLFIFGLIWAGFKLILGDDSSKRMIGSIVVAALLINFSLYVTQVVVDFTNVMAYQINALIQPAETTEVLNGWSIPNISTNFTQLTQLDQLGDRSQEVAERAGLGGSSSDTMGAAIVLGLLFTVFYSVLGFVFAAGGFILFGRFIALVFLMIFSPIIFLGYILPNFKTYSDQWKKLFFSQALVGPAFIFMLYLSLQALSGLGRMDQSEYSITNVTLYLLIVTAFVWGSLLVARSMSSWGALQAYNVGNWAQKKVGGFTAGVAARGMRSTVGWGAQKISEKDSLRDAASGRGLRGWAARRALNTTSKLGDSSFDVRNAGAVGKQLGLGDGLKGGYKTSVEELTKREKAYAEKLGQVSDDDPRVAALNLDAEATEQGIKSKKEAIQKMRKELPGLKTEDARRKKRAEIESARAEVEDMEEKHKKQKEDLQKEKQRRQLGFDNRVPDKFKTDINDRKTNIKNAQVQYASLNIKKADDLTDEEKTARDNLRETIAKEKKELAEVEKEASKLAGGYAATVENQIFARRIIEGRTKADNDNIGKEIRDEYKKKTKVA